MNAPLQRRMGRRGVTAFFGFVGVFLLSGDVLTTRDRLETLEQRIETRRRSTEHTLLKQSAFNAKTRLEQRRVEALESRLYVGLGVSALCLLFALSISMTSVEPSLMSFSMAMAGAVAWGWVDVLAPILPFFAAAALSRVPDRVWK